jgi:hypothetical protein
MDTSIKDKQWVIIPGGVPSQYGNLYCKGVIQHESTQRIVIYDPMGYIITVPRINGVVYKLKSDYELSDKSKKGIFILRWGEQSEFDFISMLSYGCGILAIPVDKLVNDDVVASIVCPDFGVPVIKDVEEAISPSIIQIDMNDKSVGNYDIVDEVSPNAIDRALKSGSDIYCHVLPESSKMRLYHLLNPDSQSGEISHGIVPDHRICMIFGPPRCGKSTHIERFVKAHENVIYFDPDKPLPVTEKTAEYKDYNQADIDFRNNPSPETAAKAFFYLQTLLNTFPVPEHMTLLIPTIIPPFGALFDGFIMLRMPVVSDAIPRPVESQLAHRPESPELYNFYTLQFTLWRGLPLFSSGRPLEFEC